MDIFILGGGCYGCQYSKWLSLARQRKKISFKKLLIVDHDINCKAPSEIIKSDWVDFLVDCIKGKIGKSSDLIVPSHAAPHLLGQAFLKFLGPDKVEMEDITLPVGLPFEKCLEKGTLAVSIADWICPPNCIEPKICPHLHKPLNWDVEKTLKEWAAKQGINHFLAFSARHFAYAVSTISMRQIRAAARDIKKILRTDGGKIIGIATSSACHGIVSVIKTSS